MDRLEYLHTFPLTIEEIFLQGIHIVSPFLLKQPATVSNQQKYLRFQPRLKFVLENLLPYLPVEKNFLSLRQSVLIGPVLITECPDSPEDLASIPRRPLSVRPFLHSSLHVRQEEHVLLLHRKHQLQQQWDRHLPE